MRDDLAEFKRGLVEQERERLSGHDYVAFHRRRYEYVLDVCTREVPDRRSLVLDVGPSRLSSALAKHYDDVTTLGYHTDGWAQEPETERGVPSRHIPFDLNDVMRGMSPVGAREYDLVVFAETIEHLHAAPELVVRMLRNLLRVGGLLVCQTPNAAALHKRARLIFGAHPYERIRIDERDPGHLREYTKVELLDIARTAGLSPVRHEYVDYFGPPDRPGAATAMGFAMYRLASGLVPSLRRGQTLLARR
jgi:2-polyprenyl-3-methyl-5-hydroxy-6-metoxy-1,4-benzoquinol methylase